VAAGLLVASIGLASLGAAHAQGLSSDDEKLYRQAFQAADEGKFDYARGLVHKASDKLLIRVLLWDEFQKPGSGATFEQIADFIRQNPTWPLIPTLVRRAEEAMTAATPDSELRPWFEANPPNCADGAIAYTRVLMDDGKTDKAAEVLRHAWINNSFGPLQEKEVLAHFARLIRPEDDNARLDRLLWDHQDEAVESQMRRVDEGHKRLARARMAFAHDRSSAENVAANLFPTDRQDPGLVYEQIRYRRERDHEDDAIPLLKSAAADKGRPDLWWTERAALARYALQKGNITQAYQIASVHGALEGQPYAEAEWLAGWIALRFLHDAPAAELHFGNLYQHVVTPIGKGRGAYWSARAFEAAGDKLAAHHWYELAAANTTSFYGQLASAQIGDGGIILDDPVPTDEEKRVFEHNELAHIARLLGQIGQTDLMRPFLLRLVEIDHSPGVRVQAAALATNLSRTDIAITVAHKSEHDGVPLIAAGYPLPQLTVGNKPERALVLGLVRQESGFQHTVVSSAGARGLMQLMPATAAKLARAYKMVFKRKNTLNSALTHDPNLNLKLGSAYLGDLLNQFDGSYILAIAAYNAGPARVEKWIRDYGDPRAHDVDAVDWVESIPFSETRNYVQRVMEGVQVYRQRLGTPAPGLALTLDSDLKRSRKD
jgi:soluble lytic murein transglycosylase